MSKPYRIDHKELGNFSIDEANNLYWNDKKIKAESVMSKGTAAWLWLVTALSIIGAISGIAGGVVSINKEFCFFESRSCPAETKPEDTADTSDKTSF